MVLAQSGPQDEGGKERWVLRQLARVLGPHVVEAMVVRQAGRHEAPNSWAPESKKTKRS